MSQYIYIETHRPEQLPEISRTVEKDRFAVRRGVIIIDDSGEVEYDSNAPENVLTTTTKPVIIF